MSAKKTKEKTLRVFVVEPGKKPGPRDVTPGLSSIQSLVGGDLQAIPGVVVSEITAARMIAYCNEAPPGPDAKPCVRLADGQVVHGPVVLVGVGPNGSSLSLGATQADVAAKWAAKARKVKS